MTLKSETKMTEHGSYDDRLLSVTEAAKYLGVSERTVWDLADRSVIPSVRIGRRRLFRRATLVEWVENMEGQGDGQQN